MFLLIKNKGICPVEGFTILGLSTSRGTELIGQFGSGAKHGVLTLLRANVMPVIYLGSEKLSFGTTDASMGDRPYKRVFYEWKGERVPLSLALEFGAIDWTKIEYGLREFVSNALDAVDLDASAVTVELVPDIIADDDTSTRVYLPASVEVIRFFGSLHDYFLHFRGSHNATFLEKEPGSKGRIYRKGVFVRETRAVSIFDYNLHTSTIDECRNMSDPSVFDAVGTLIERLHDVESIKLVLKHLPKLTDTFEGQIPYYAVNIPLESRQLWKTAFDALYPEALLWYDDVGNNSIAQKAAAKGGQVILVPNGWFQMLSQCGVPSAISGLGYRTVGTRKIEEPSGLLLKNVTLIWNGLLAAGMTAGKSMPAVRSFEEIMDGGSETHGFYQNGTVYLLRGQENNLACILEELGHHVTGASDYSRDLQDWAFKVAVAWRKR